MSQIVSRSFRTKPGDPVEGPGWLDRKSEDDEGEDKQQPECEAAPEPVSDDK